MSSIAESGSADGPDGPEEGPTDEVSGIADTFVGGIGQADPDAGAGFEHRRAVANARMRLFGKAPQLRIGRYVIQGRLGAGGMGEVYLGHDPELDRDVAIKRVLPDRGGEREQLRLRREAKALARLSHPNVVQVYDSGEYEGRMFLAMEYIAGSTLKDWLEQEPRGWRDILAKFVAAGRGLAAAHEAGVVHRDFKPENVLIGEDGLIRVADFGLAIAPTRASQARPGRVPDEQEASEIASWATTKVSSVAGTIRFMSLEQLRGEAIDERSDQFAFCVALYEALWEDVPYSLESVHDRLDALETEQLRTPQLQGIPQVAWRVVRRGLSVPGEQRWPDMASLLAALESALRWRRRVALGVTGGLLTGLVGVGLALASGTPTCSEQAIAAQLDQVWSPAIHERLAAGVAAAGVEHGSESLARIVAGIDAWTQHWVSEQTALCQAEVSGALSPELGRMQSQCLALQQRQVAGFINALVDQTLEARAIAGAVAAVADLPAASSCDDYAASLLVPPGPAIEAEVSALREQLFLGHELRLLGRFEQGRALVEEARVRAEQLDYGPLEAEALAEAAKAELDSGSLERGLEQLLDGIDAAEASRHDRLAAELWTVASLRTTSRLDDPELGGLWLRRARAGWARVEPEPRFVAMLDYADGHVAAAEGRYAEAQLAYARALAVLDEQEQVLPEHSDVLSALAWVLEQQEPQSEAIVPSYERALRSAEAFWGQHHPSVAIHAYNLGLASKRAGEMEQAQALFSRAAKLWTSGYERPHPAWADARRSLALMAFERGDLDEAEGHAKRLAELEEVVLPEGHPDRAYSDIFLAKLHALREQRELALSFTERALDKLRGVEASDTRVLELRAEQANHLLALERQDDAERSYEALIEGARRSAPVATIPAFLGLAELELRRGQTEAAAAQLARLEALGLSSEQIGVYELSKALLDALVRLRLGGDARLELDRLEAAQARSPFTAEQLEAWFEDLALTSAERQTLGY